MESRIQRWSSEKRCWLRLCGPCFQPRGCTPCMAAPKEYWPLSRSTSLFLTSPGIECMTPRVSWFESLKPMPSLPPASLNDAERDQLKVVWHCSWFQILTMELTSAEGVLQLYFERRSFQ